MADVFVSYSRRDIEFVRGLHAFLTGAGRDVWVDWDDIPPASKWEQDIDDSIDAAESFVFVASPESLASEWCTTELRHAEERGKRIVPLAIDGAEPEDAPTGLRELNWIWCRGIDDSDAAFTALAAALDTDLDWARAHTRLLVRAVEWDARSDGSLLLRGKDLAEAERAVAGNAGKDPRPTELQQRYLHASRRAATRRQRALLGGVTIALGVAVALGVVALLQRSTAIGQRNAARSVALASASRDQLAAHHPDVALLLALEAIRARPSVQSRSAMTSALEATRGVDAIVRSYGNINGWTGLDPTLRVLALVREGSVRLWDSRSRSWLGEAIPVAGRVFGVDPGPGGRVVGVEDGNGLRLRDTREHRWLGPPLHRCYTDIAFAPDGRTFTCSNSPRVRFWRLGAGLAPLGTVRGEAPAFSRDGRTIATAAGRFTVLRDARTFAPLGRLRGRAVFGADGRAVASVEGRTVQLWNARTAEPLSPPRRFAQPVRAVSPDLRTVIAGGEDEPGRLLDLRTGAPRGRLRGDSETFSPDGRLVAAVVHSRSVAVWNARTGALRPGPPRTAPEGVIDQWFSADGRRLAASGVGATTVLWDPWATDRALTGTAPSLPGIAFSPDGRTLASIDGGHVLLWSVRTRVRIGSLRGKGATELRHVAFGPKGRTVAAADDSRVYLWTVRTGLPLARLPGGDAAFSPDGRTFATADGTSIRFRDLRTMKEARKALDVGPRAATGVAFSPDGGTLASTDGTRTRLWNLDTGRELGPPLTGALLEYARDGGKLVTATEDFSTVQLWDARTHARLGGPIVGFDAAFSPDGGTLATATERNVRLWDVSTHSQLGRPLLGHTGQVHAVAFSPDGRTLASGQEDGPVRLWQNVVWRDLADLSARVCHVAWQDLTRAEWTAYAPELPPHATCGR